MRTPIRLLVPSLVTSLLAASGCYKGKYEETLKAKQALETSLADCETTKATLTQDLDSEKAARAEAEQTLATIQQDLQATRGDLAALKTQREEIERRLAAFRDLTARFQKMIDAGRLKVYIRGGRMIVNLPSGVLFDSGKADLSDQGKQALAEVAAILKEFPDRRFLIAGHTDNVPIRTRKFKDNWELSSARALTVTKFLVEQGMAPANMAAAGYAENDPIGDNTSEPGRQENRRIELILVPNIDELPKLPGDMQKAVPAAGS